MDPLKDYGLTTPFLQCTSDVDCMEHGPTMLPAWSFSRLPSVVTWIVRILEPQACTKTDGLVVVSRHELVDALNIAPMRGSSPETVGVPTVSADSAHTNCLGRQCIGARPSANQSYKSRPATASTESEELEEVIGDPWRTTSVIHQRQRLPAAVPPPLGAVVPPAVHRGSLDHGQEEGLEGYAGDVSLDIDRASLLHDSLVLVSSFCGCREAAIATNHCASCVENLCSVCAAAHSSTGAFAGHTLRVLDVGSASKKEMGISFGSSTMSIAEWQSKSSFTEEGSDVRTVSRGRSPVRISRPSTNNASPRRSSVDDCTLTIQSHKSRPATTFIEEELEEVLAARNTRTKYNTPSRPSTNYIDEEVREILAARSSSNRRISKNNKNSSVLQPPPVRDQKTMKCKVPNRAKTGRYVQRPDDCHKLERDARILRKELQSLDSKIMQRVHVLKVRREAPIERGVAFQSENFQLPSSTMNSSDSLNRLNRDTKLLPQIIPERDGQKTNESSECSSPEDFTILNSDVDLVGSTGGADSKEASSIALGSSKKSCIEKSCTLLQNTTLSVINKYWYKTRNDDLLYLLLHDEQEMIERAILLSGHKISRKKLEQERKAAQQADDHHQQALKTIRNPQKAEHFHAVAYLQAALQREMMELAKMEAEKSQKYYHAYHEVAKWKDSLTPEEDTELSARKYALKIADQTSTDTQVEYEKQYQVEFLRAAECDEQSRQFLDSNRVETAADRNTLRAVEVGHLHSRNEEGAQVESQMVSNHVFAALSWYAQDVSLPHIPTMFLFHALLGQLPQQEHLGCMNVLDQFEYAGQWVGGKAHGMGVEKLHSQQGHGNRYEGQMLDDLRHGLGALTMKELAVMYEGMWWHGKRHGVGVESHLVKGSADPLPIGFVQYEAGRRISTARFDLRSDIHLYVLEKVRRIRLSARALAAEARSNELLQHILPATKRSRFGTSSRSDTADLLELQSKAIGTASMSGTGQSFQTIAEDSVLNNENEGDDGDDDDGEPRVRSNSKEERDSNQRRRQKVKDKKRRQVKKQAEREEQDVSVTFQRSELEKIDTQVDYAMQDLKDSTTRAFVDFEQALVAAGLKSGKLYGLTVEETKSVALRMPQAPTQETLVKFLGRQAVPEELAQRMATIYLERLGPGSCSTLEKIHEIEQMRLAIILKLSENSDWHAQDMGRAVIRKRYTGLRTRCIDDKEIAPRVKSRDWEHMPAIPGLEAVLKLMPTVRGAVLSSGVGAGGSGGRGKFPPTKMFGQTAKGGKEKPSLPIITVPMDMPLDVAVRAFNADEYQHILLLPGTYKIKGTLEVDKSLHIVGEDGARVIGKWKLKNDGAKTSIKNVHLEYHGKQESSSYQRLLHIHRGEVLLQDCALLCPGGYCLWADGRGVVNVLGCILAGSADGASPAQASAVVLNFRCVHLLPCHAHTHTHTHIHTHAHAHARAHTHAHAHAHTYTHTYTVPANAESTDK